MTAIDATGLHALEQLNERLRKSGRVLILCGARQQPAAFLDQAEFVQHVGANNIVPKSKPRCCGRGSFRRRRAQAVRRIVECPFPSARQTSTT